MKDELENKLRAFSGTEFANILLEYLKIKREKYRDKLEAAESPEYRGMAKECKELINIFKREV